MLIVEDDDFKYERIFDVLTKNGHTKFRRVTSVREAIEEIESNSFATIILDMSLPSRPLRQGDISPTSMLSGGIEVLLNMQVRGHEAFVIVLTQYPEVEIEGQLKPIRDVRDALLEEYDYQVGAVIHYQHERQEWEDDLLKALKNQ